MPKVEWGVLGEHFFEVGVDRGMLYVSGIAGVPWNGLIKVSENPSGGASREFYLDGDKYLNLPSLEEYSATVDAVSSPREILPCAGWIQVIPGVYATNQPPASFGFSYRTLTGDDIQGPGAGYKIHIVYNVSARLSEVVHQTIAASPNMKPYSWIFEAVPEPFIDYKPSAHFVVNTTTVGEDIVQGIEDILYGTDTDDPRMPDVSELMNILIQAGTTGDMVLKKMIVAITGKGKSVGTGALSFKKMRIAITAPVKTRATAAIRLKKMTIAITAPAKSVTTGGPKLKKMKLAVNMTTPFSRSNTLEGGTNGTTVSTGNSGGTSGNAFDSAQIGGTGGVCAYDNVHAMAGSLALAISSSATVVDPYAGWTLPNLPKIYGRFYVWVPSNPAANWRMMGVYGTAPNVNVRMFLRFTTAGKLVLLDSASTVIWTSTGSVPLGSWQRIEFMVAGHASAGQLSVDYYAGSATTATESSGVFTNQATGGDLGSVIHGIPSPQANVAKTWFDNLALSNAGPIGP